MKKARRRKRSPPKKPRTSARTAQGVGLRQGHGALDRFADRTVESLLKLEQPDVLYHYTSWEGLTGILSECAMRATDYRYMDDIAELGHADAVVEGIVDSIAPEFEGTAAGRALAGFRLRYNQFKLISKPDAFRFFLLCFCLEAERPHLWDKFGQQGRGYCLGIRTLRDEARKLDTTLLSSVGGPVVYDQDGLAERMTHAFRSLLGELNAHPLRDRWRARKIVLNALFRMAGHANLTAKAREFAAEQEWRIAIWERRKGHGMKMGAGSRPYLLWPLRAQSKPIALDSIHVGIQNGQQGVSDVKALLVGLRYGAEGMPPMPRVVLSTIEWSSAD